MLSSICGNLCCLTTQARLSTRYATNSSLRALMFLRLIPCSACCFFVVVSTLHSYSPRLYLDLRLAQPQSLHAVSSLGIYCRSMMCCTAQNRAGTTHSSCLCLGLSVAESLSSSGHLQNGTAVISMYFFSYRVVSCAFFVRSAHASAP